jgi:hypothetical protein
MQFAAYGDDATTPETDGYASGQAYVWYINIDGNDYPTEATYFVGGPFTNVYQTNQLTRVTHFSIESSDDDIEGCTDAAYLEFNSEATIDDNSCVTLINEGCMDDNYLEYSEVANYDTDPSSCINILVIGCADVVAFNYDPLVNVNDPTQCEYFIECDCCNFEQAFDYEQISDCYVYCEAVDCIFEYGCMDASACNFNSMATVEDGSCIYPGCTDNSYVEFYNQGYVAGCDDGSCSIDVEDLGLIIENFQEPMITGSSMTVGFNISNINGIGSGTIAAFYDLNGDGLINTNPYIALNGLSYWECIGSTEYIPNEFFSMGLWGDDSTTDEIEGLQDGQTDVIFALLTDENQVIAFNLVPEFTSYNTNGIIVVNELNLEVTKYGCMNSDYCNYNPDAEEDDGTCEGVPGCMDALYVEYDSTLGCNNQDMCLVTWEQAYYLSEEANNTLEFELDNSTISIMILEDLINNLEQQNNVAYIQITDLEAQLDTVIDLLEWCLSSGVECAQQLNILELEWALCTEDLNYWSSPIEIDLLTGWNIIGYTFPEPQDVVATVVEIDDIIQIIKNNAAAVYWPEYGFNGIGDFIPGQGYQIKVFEGYSGFTYPDVGGLRIELVPTVPQWALDMKAEIHPNDIRTLVRVVNMLGQEVNYKNQPTGTTLLYLYNDGTVENKIK